MSSKFEYYKKYEPIFGAWEIVDLISAESLGSVFKISRSDFGTTFYSALKIITIPQSDAEYNRILAECGSEEKAAEYIEETVKCIASDLVLMSKLRGHSNIINYEDHTIIPHENGIGKDILIRMELLSPMPGFSAASFLPETEIVNLGIDICKALEMCEKHNIVHKDIKPESIFRSNTGSYKLGNFDIARRYIKRGTESFSSLTYMSPEVYNNLDADIRSDIYSLGILLYRLLNKNAAPFMPAASLQASFNEKEKAIKERLSGSALPAPCGTSDPELCNAVLKACSFDPDDRFSSAAEMRAALEKALVSVAAAAAVSGEKSNIDAYGTKKEESVTPPPVIPAISDINEEFNEKTLYVPGVPTTEAPEIPETHEKAGRKKRKKGKVFLILIIILLILALIGAGVFFGLKYLNSMNSDDGDDEEISASDNNPDDTQTECNHENLKEKNRSDKKYTSAYTYDQIVTSECLDCGDVLTYTKPYSDPALETSLGYGALTDELFYRIDKNGTMTILGKGEIPNYDGSSYYPWYPEKTNVFSLVIEDGITSVGGMAFMDFDNLKMVSFPESVTGIGEMAFYGCDSLNEISISDSVTNIEKQAFGNCAGIDKFSVDRNNPNYESYSGVLFDKDRITLIQYPADSVNATYSVPSTVDRIGAGAFSGCENLSTVIIPDSVTVIETKAFENCVNLSKISISSSVNHIEEMAFMYCENLSEITVTSSNEHYSSENGVLFNKDKTVLVHYPASKNDQSYSIPESVKSITPYAFLGIKNLKEITVGKSTAVTPEAFGETYYALSGNIAINGYTGSSAEAFAKNGYVEFRILDAPEDNGSQIYRDPNAYIIANGSCGTNVYWKITSDGVIAIYGQGNMYDYGNASDVPWYTYRTYFSTAILENGVTSIGSRAFMNHSTLQQISIPNTVVKIGEYAFYDSDKLRSIYIPASVTNLEKGALFYSKGIQSITVDNSNSVYSSLDGVLFNKSRTSLIQYPVGDSSRSSYSIPNGVTTVEYGAFGGSKYLTTVNIPDSVRTLRDRTFTFCSALTSITIPKNVSTIEKCVFRNCTALTGIYVNSGNRYFTSDSGVLYTGDMSRLMHYPANRPGTKYTIPSYVSHIDENAFLANRHLNEVDILNRYISFGERVFKQNKSDSISHYFRLNVFRGSTAASYAANNNLSYAYYIE